MSSDESFPRENERRGGDVAATLREYVRVAENGAWRCACGEWNHPWQVVCSRCWRPQEEASSDHAK